MGIMEVRDPMSRKDVPPSFIDMTRMIYIDLYIFFHIIIHQSCPIWGMKRGLAHIPLEESIVLGCS
jgi:hypothetical protein